MQPDMSQLQGGSTPLDPGEIALAMWGIGALLKGEHDKAPRFGLGKLREMAKIEQRLFDNALKVAKGHDGTLPHWAPESDYAEMLKRLSSPLAPEELQELVERFPPEAHAISGPFLIVAQRAWQYLQGSFPTSRYMTFTGPETMVPDDDKTWQFLTCLHVIQDPFLAYDLIGSGALLPSHVACLRAVYPSLCEHITTSIYAAIATEKAADPKYRLPFAAEQGWATWTGRRIADFKPPGPPDKDAAPPAAGQGSQPQQPVTSPNPNLRTPTAKAAAAS